MRWNTAPKWMLISGGLAIAAMLTAGAYFWNVGAAEEAQRESLTHLARQVSSQVENLALVARQRGERDPYVWAAERLAQAPEPRVMRVSASRGEPGALSEALESTADPLVLAYTRVLSAQDGMGVKVLLARSYVGFLGATTRAGSDLGVALCFLLIFWSLCGPVVLRKPQSDSSDVKEMTRIWLRDAKGILAELGVHIREMIRSAHSLTLAAAKSHSSVDELRSRVHGEIEEVRQLRRALKETIETAKKAEVVALNLVIEATRMGEQGGRVAEMTPELHQLVKSVYKQAEGSDLAALDLERRLEPMATDADVAYHAFDELFQTTRGMDGQIRKTTEQLISQAKLIQSANLKLAEPK